MKVAVIDMGTNTFHLLIVDVESKSHFSTIYREKVAVKIGKKGIMHGKITDEAYERAINAVSDFKVEINKHKVESIYATATSAIRNAINGKDLVYDIKKKTGIETKIITGTEEAEYIHYGVKNALDIGDEKALIMDIGGGSIEFIIADNKKEYWKNSFEIGGQRMIEKFHKNDPITIDEINNLEKFLIQSLTELFDECAKHLPKTLIGSSGTFDTLSDIYREENEILKDDQLTELPFDLQSFESIYQKIISNNKKERLLIPGMIEMRVDMIVVACILVKFIIDGLDIKKVRISAYALKEGVLLKTIHAISETTDIES